MRDGGAATAQLIMGRKSKLLQRIQRPKQSPIRPAHHPPACLWGRAHNKPTSTHLVMANTCVGEKSVGRVAQCWEVEENANWGQRATTVG